MQRIVIIGAGQAAAWAVHTLRQEGFNGEINIISDEEKVFYERPPLSKQMLLANENYDSINIFPSDVMESFAVKWHKPNLAKRIDRIKKEVYLDNGEILPYDKLLIATGSKPRIPNNHWKSYKNIFTLRNIEDCKDLSSAIYNAQKIGIIGGGWIGLEVASTIRKLGKEVHIFEIADRLCARSVSPEVSDFLSNIHYKAGVIIHYGIKNLLLDEVNCQYIEVTHNEQKQDFDIIIVGAGVEISSQLAEEAGLKINNGIVVNRYGQTSDSNIYAAGDVAVHPDLGYCLQSWANAQNQAIATAKSMLGNYTEYTEVPWLWSDQYHYNIQILGTYRPDLIDKIAIRESSVDKKSFFYLDEKNRLLNMIAVNEPKLIKLGKRWMKARTILDISLLENPDFNLMMLKP